MNTTRKHILVVDDEQETTLQIKRALANNLDYVIDSSCDGIEALSKLREVDHYDLLVLDILVPKLNGIEVCEFMIQDQRLKRIPILLISILPLNSDDFKRSLVKFKEFAVVKDVLEKPFSNEDLLLKVDNIIKLFN